jgi:hypothetical protein
MVVLAKKVWIKWEVNRSRPVNVDDVELPHVLEIIRENTVDLSKWRFSFHESSLWSPLLNSAENSAEFWGRNILTKIPILSKAFEHEKYMWVLEHTNFSSSRLLFLASRD